MHINGTCQIRKSVLFPLGLRSPTMSIGFRAPLTRRRPKGPGGGQFASGVRPQDPVSVIDMPEPAGRGKAGCGLCGVPHRGRCRRSVLEFAARSWAASHRRIDDPARQNTPGAAGPNPYACDLCGLPHNRTFQCRRSALESAARLRAAANASTIATRNTESPGSGARDPYACGHCHQLKETCRCRPKDRIWH